MRTFLQRRWFLVALVLIVFAGATSHTDLAATAHAIPQNWLIALIMVLTAAPIDLLSTLRARGTLRAAGLAILINVMAAPPLAWLAGRLLPEPLAVGLIVAMASPCTLASASVWTRRGGGNDTAALLVTLVTTLGCFLIVPAWTALLLSESAQVEFWAMATKLLVWVVTPILLTQLARRYGPLGDALRRAKAPIAVAAQLGVLTMVFIGAVESGATLARDEFSVSAGAWCGLLAGVVAVHLTLLLSGWHLALHLGLGRPDAIATAIAGSQKTLTVGLSIALDFGGLTILPMIVYHVTQLFLDTLFVDRVRVPDRPTDPNRPTPRKQSDDQAGGLEAPQAGA